MNLTITIPTPPFELSSSSSDSRTLSTESPRTHHRRVSWASELSTDLESLTSANSLSKSSGNESRPISTSPPIEASRLSSSDLISFDRYIINLFKSALDQHKNAVNNLLLHPLFKDRIFDVLVEKKTNLRRINLLNHLAHHHINKLEKQEVKDLINAVGVSTYVSLAASKKVESLYRALFRYQHSSLKKETFDSETDSSLVEGPSSMTSPYRREQEEYTETSSLPQEPFSYLELVEFRSQANEALRPYISTYIKRRFPHLT